MKQLISLNEKVITIGHQLAHYLSSVKETTAEFGTKLMLYSLYLLQIASCDLF
jgi:hypothetical protein